MIIAIFAHDESHEEISPGIYFCSHFSGQITAKKDCKDDQKE